MSSITQHEVKPAAAILMDDVICQSFIQSSSTLAYACILIRHLKYELATHVLHSLEAKQASRFKEMVFYLQAQVGIETGEYAFVKKRLVPRVNQHPNDMVALSLLEACIYQEWAQAQGAQSRSQNGAATRAEELGIREIREPLPEKGIEPAPVQSPKPSPSVMSDAAPALMFAAKEAPQAPIPIPTAPVLPVSMEIGDSDFGIYQNLAGDQNTLALVTGNHHTGKFKSTCRTSGLEPLIAILPNLLPGAITTACQTFETGDIHKICFSFQNLTVTSLHNGAECLELVTGNINQSLLTMVRAENLFQKQSATAQGRARLPSTGSEGRFP